MTENLYSAKVDVDYGDAIQATAVLNAQLRDMESLFRTAGEGGEELETTFLQQIDAANRLRGNLDDVSDQLKLYGPAGESAALALEGITDAGLRLRLSQELLAKQLHAGRDPFVALGNQAKALEARFHMLGPATKAVITAGFGALVVAVGAAGAALGKFLSDSVSSFIKGSVELQGQTAALEASYSRLTAKVGKLIAEHLRLDDALVSSKENVDALSTFLDANAQKVDDVLQTVKELGVGAARVFSYTLPAALTPLAATVDALRFGFMGLFALLTEGAAQVAEGLAELGVVSGDTAKSLRRGADDVTKQAAGMKSLTKSVWETSDAFRDGLDELDLTKSKIEGLGDATGKTASAYGELTRRIGHLDDELRSSAIQATGDLALKLRAAGVETDVIRAYTDDLTRALTSGTITVEQYKESLAGLSGVSLDLKSPTVQKAKADPKAAEERKAAREELLRGWAEEIAQRQRNLKAVEDMDRRFREATQTSGARRELVDKYADDPMFRQLEAAKDLIQQGKDAAAAKRAEADAILAENQRIRESYDQMNLAISSAADSAISFGIDTATGIAQALAAGEGLGGMWKSALADLGTFAVNTGKTLILAGLGKQALDLGLPGAAVIGIGAGMVGLGVTLGGLFGGSRGSASTPRPTNQLSAQRDAWSERNRDVKADRQAPQVMVVAQFGDDRLEPTVVRLERAAQRNGRTSSGGRL